MTITAPTIGVPQLTAAGALLSILSANATLPGPHVTLHIVVPGGDDRPSQWGVELTLEDDPAGFEQWRTALGIDLTAVRSDHCDLTAWLITRTVRAGVPVTLVVYFDRPDPDDEDE
ncbi:hypothetical protein ACIQOV_33665 [Kitasatospora sp. NPDC091257]|uniref:hypothetical protein n=1 Tax=Kitasatospora sp. NPDC091257 TaxID=3364084 RepID=UPI00380BFE35